MNSVLRLCVVNYNNECIKQCGTKQEYLKAWVCQFIIYICEWFIEMKTRHMECLVDEIKFYFIIINIFIQSEIFIHIIILSYREWWFFNIVHFIL